MTGLAPDRPSAPVWSDTARAFDVLCEKARLNAAVFRARTELFTARVGTHCARTELREQRTTPARAAEAMAREASAEAALDAAVAAWMPRGDRLDSEFYAALPDRLRGGPAPVGVSFNAAVSALTARFGAPAKEDSQGGRRGAYWKLDVWEGEGPDRARAAWRDFGVCEDITPKDNVCGSRVRVFGRASGTGWEIWGSAEVNTLVAVESDLSGAIRRAYLGHDARRQADPGQYSEQPTDRWAAAAWAKEREEELARWRPWAFDAPATAEGMLRRYHDSPPCLAPLALAVDAVALMLDVPRRREAG